MNIDKKNHKTKIMKVAFIFYSMIEMNVDGASPSENGDDMKTAADWQRHGSGQVYKDQFP
ncbi:hypothetical protein V8Z74_10345 [Comamonas sp. w2-DMI]|uniref:hypothetical protein n=1 Tax=Comamonas sp. w2-DMI TaxID=3126391 RepID=UPI0032E4B353